MSLLSKLRSSEGGVTSGRKLTVCIDGTSNQFSRKNTNVVELYSRIIKDKTQLTYYNSGIGTFAESPWTLAYAQQFVDNTIDLAIAWNFKKVILGAYRWLSDVYEPGDQIYFFGFSRGAYQVRTLAAMLTVVGLLYPGNQEQIPFAWELYMSTKAKDAANGALVSKFKETFCQKEVDVHFLGAWDTVSSVGIFRDQLLPSTQHCEHITHFRHALALDERRVKFLPEYVAHPDRTQAKGKPQVKNLSLKEVWFAGTHSDIGGGNKENIDLNRRAQPLLWMMEEAEKAGLKLEAHAVDGVGTDGTAVTESLAWHWWPFEYWPFQRASYESSDSVTRQLHLGEGRKVIINASHRQTTGYSQKIHWTVFASQKGFFQDQTYKPKAKLHRGAELVSWESVFGKALDQGQKFWEGSPNSFKMLELISELDNPNDTWASRMLSHVREPDNAKTAWTYGGLDLFRKMATNDKVISNEALESITLLVLGLYCDNARYDLPCGKERAENSGLIPSTVISATLPCLKVLLELCRAKGHKPLSMADANIQPPKTSFLSWLKSLSPWATVADSTTVEKKLGTEQEDHPDLYDQAALRLGAIIADIISTLATGPSDVADSVEMGGILNRVLTIIPLDPHVDQALLRRIVRAISRIASNKLSRRAIFSAKSLRRIIHGLTPVAAGAPHADNDDPSSESKIVQLFDGNTPLALIMMPIFTLSPGFINEKIVACWISALTKEPAIDQTTLQAINHIFTWDMNAEIDIDTRITIQILRQHLISELVRFMQSADLQLAYKAVALAAEFVKTSEESVRQELATKDVIDVLIELFNNASENKEVDAHGNIILKAFDFIKSLSYNGNARKKLINAGVYKMGQEPTKKSWPPRVINAARSFVDHVQETYSDVRDDLRASQPTNDRVEQPLEAARRQLLRQRIIRSGSSRSMATRGLPRHRLSTLPSAPAKQSPTPGSSIHPEDEGPVDHPI